MPSWKELSSVSGCEGWGGIQALILSLLAGTGSGQGQRAGHSPFLGTRGGSTLPESRAGSGAGRTFRETSVSRGETPMAGSHGFVFLKKKKIVIIIFFNFQVNKSLSACLNSPL